LGCPAINAFYDDELIEHDTNHQEDGQKERELKYYIDEARCVPKICPGICKNVCKNYSIKKTIINPE